LDDYQTAHRSRFLGRRGEWVSPRQLTARNAFWDATSAALKAGTLRALLVTRVDTRAGLASFELTEDRRSITVGPLAQGSLMPLLSSLTADDGKGVVVSEPANGWEELKERLARDLPRDGLVLPQQVRLVLLGLASGPPPEVLTPSRYRSYGGAAGTEGRYVGAAIRVAASETGAPVAEVRALLGRLVEPGTGSTDPKTRDATASELADAAGPAAGVGVSAILAALERTEIVRRAPGIDGGDIWRLDHDYLARAVLAEARAADRYAVALREDAERWRAAAGDFLERWRRLLPVRRQVWLLWGRLCGKFRYGAERGYAALSCVPALLVLTLVAGPTWWGALELQLQGRAQAIVSALQDNADGDSAVLDLWSAPAAVRHRFLPILVTSRSRLLNGGSTWPLALVGLSEPEAKALAGDLQKRLAAGGVDYATQRSLIKALGAVAPRLGEVPAKELAADLIKRLGAGGVDSDTQRSLVDALGAVAPRLGEELAEDLRQRLAVGGVDSDTQRSLIEALGAVAPRLGEVPAEELAADLRQRLAAGGVDSDTQRSLIEALGGVAPRLGEVPAKELAADLRQRLAAGGVDSDTQRSLTETLGAVAPRLGEVPAKELAADLRQRLAAGGVDSDTQRSLIEALGAVAWRLGEVPAKELAADLSQRLAAGVDYATHLSLIEALDAVAPRLGEVPAQELAADLRQRLAAGGVDSNTQRSLIEALGVVAPRLGDVPAKELAEALRERLVTEQGASTREAVLTALATIGRRTWTDEVAQRRAAQDILIALSWPLSGMHDIEADFAALERIAGHSFDGDLMMAFSWAHDTYGFDPDDIRPGG
jgi:translation initiation factor 1 (eIF-1/SUI1)